MRANHSRVLDESRLSVTQAARYAGASPTSVVRWCRQGRRGVRLEHVRAGERKIITSREALRRFFDRLTELDLASVGAAAGAADTQTNEARETEAARRGL